MARLIFYGKKSNNDKYKDAVYKNGEADNLFRLPNNPASVILKYLDPQTELNALKANKQWAQKIIKIKLLQKRKEYLKYFLWYVYGCGNAERLCKIVDDVMNKFDENDENKDDIIMEYENNDKSNNEDKKFLLWHMILLDILNIKMSDLKLDFEKEKSESVGEAIKKHLLSEEAVKRRNDFIDSKKIMSVSSSSETLLWEYCRQIFPEFKNIQLELEHGFTKYYPMYKYIKIDLSTKELLRNIFPCFFKVSFYQMQIVKNLDEYKDNQLVYKRYKNQIYDFNRYLRKKIFYYVRNGRIEFTEYMAAYLFETGELDQWFLNYKKDFFNFFCRENSFDKLNKDEIAIEFRYFAYYLNENKQLEKRYEENANQFWRNFLTDITKKGSTTEYDILRFYITPYISEKSLKNKMKIEIMKMTGWSNKYLEASRHGMPSFFYHNSLKYNGSNAEKNYFNPIIIRFCGKKDLSDKVIQSISKVIKSKDGVDHEDEDKINEKNKVGSWQHFIFILFFIFACLSLFLCFKISLYFLILVAMFTACDLYLGFKNYCRGCCYIYKIKTHVTDTDKNNFANILDSGPGQNLIDNELEI